MSLFSKQIPVVQIKTPYNFIKDLQKQLKEFLITLPKFKQCQPIENDPQKKILIFNKFNSNKHNIEEIVNKLKNEYENQIEIEEKTHEISYDNYSMNEALKIIMNA